MLSRLAAALLLLVFLISIGHSRSQCLNLTQPALSDELNALLVFRNSLQNASVLSLDVKSWKGVKWSSNGQHVTNLTLSGCNLTGILLPIWNMFPFLEHLDLSGNNLSGILNVTYCHNHLKLVNLSRNSLGGSIQQLLGFANLQQVDLSCNFFSGKLPKSLSSLKSLVSLNISQNNVTGEIPAEVGDMQSLEELGISHNILTGSVPNEIGKLTRLKRLILSENQITGMIPSSLKNCRDLDQLDLSNNNIVGGIPAELGGLPNLRVLSVGFNSLSYDLQFTTSAFPNLETLYVPQNKLHGNIPKSIGNLVNLRKLVLQGNSLNGSIPIELGACRHLEEIWLNNNKLIGSIPDEILRLPNLRLLALNNNYLSGKIPAALGNVTNLEVLWLEQNKFSGEIPVELGNLQRLLMISLSGNMLTGKVPSSLGKLKTVIGLDLGFNDLTGGIPSVLSGLTSVQFFFLSNNRLKGSIPDWIGNLSTLRALDLSFNNFTGEIPSTMVSLNAMRKGSRYNENEPSAWVHTPEGRIYKGFALPTTIDLSHNNLTGFIPNILGSLQNLQALDLSFNNLFGTIPPSLGNCTNLLRLDLSNNHLSGQIPISFSKLSFLGVLNLSNNNLFGRIPESGQMNAFGASSFLGNKLCGTQVNVTCSSLSGVGAFGMARKSVTCKLLPLYVTLCAALGLCVFLVVHLALARRRHKLFSNTGGGESNEQKMSKSGVYEAMTFSENFPVKLCPNSLAIATENYSHANILGDGGFGIVYRAVLESGDVVAVKKLSSGGIQGDREFRAEVLTLGDICHKNLVPLLGYCSDGNDRLLIYEYLKNGSLDTWLYCREEGMKSLDWATRLKIVRGAAEGIAFLHHVRNPSIIHRDIKVSNILLDTDFNAHVADFGLARLVNAGDTHVSTDVAGTIGYIPPEYNHKCIATTKGDVYSFGVVCLEIVTGKRPTDQCFRKSGAGHLVAWILSMKTANDQRQALDSSLLVGDENCVDEMLEMIRVACLCCRDLPSRRPTMLEVVGMLQNLGNLSSL